MFGDLLRLTYETLQQGKIYAGSTQRLLVSQFGNLFYPTPERQTQPLSQEFLLKMQEMTRHLLEVDWQDAEQGVYPKSLLFDNHWEDLFRYYPAFLLDIPLVWERKQRKKYQSFAPEIKTDNYPSYYVQNFHFQTNGYLSSQSADLYDLQVDFTFAGLADAMRRRILAPLKRGLEYASPKQVRILDVACGTGRTLKSIRECLPQASLFGVDLSLEYLRKANELLSQIPGELPQLIQANAEELPYLDNYFHAVTSVFLFHELPAVVRQTIIEECFRVTKPGGIFIICDSIQLDDVPEVNSAIDGFPKEFHEPYYRNYAVDNLVERLEKAGFESIETQTHFLSKYFIARKPV